MLSAIAQVLMGGGGAAAALYLAKKFLIQTDTPQNRCPPAVFIAAGMLGCFFIRLHDAHGGWSARAVLLALILWAFIAAAECDLAERRIPNPLVWAVLGGAVLYAVRLIFNGKEAVLEYLLSAAVGGGVLLVVLILCRIIFRGGIGYGDIKMLSAAGVALGLFGGFSVWFFSQLTAAVVAVVLLVTHKAGKKDGLPFAPFLVIGFLIVLAYGGV